MRRAGVNVHHYLRSPPPWLNQPGIRFVSAYLNPRSTEISDSDALAEVEGEVEKMADFLTQEASIGRFVFQDDGYSARQTRLGEIKALLLQLLA